MGKKAGRKKWLSALVALSLMAGGVVEARDHQVISYDGHDVFDIVYVDKADQGHWVQEIFDGESTDENWQPLSYDLTADMKSWFNAACLQWAEIIRPGLANIKQPAQLLVGSGNYVNCTTLNWDVADGHNYFKNVLMAGEEVPYTDFWDRNAYYDQDFYGFCRFVAGMGLGIDHGEGIYGWNESSKSQLNHNATTADLTAVTFHELGHALGLYCDTHKLGTTDDAQIGHNSGLYFGSLADDPTDINSHLLDQNGNKARAGQIIVVPDDGYTADQIRIMNENPDTYFQVSSEAAVSPDSAVGRVFFTGTHVSEVLDGKTFWGIDGVPILSWEKGFLELSHIELERSLMSHQTYRSYNTFMEAELAVMQDIGYQIDRKNFYGKSIYKSDETDIVNTQGFFARNEEGTAYIKGQPNTATLGVGLHVYGSRNEITQTSDGKNDGSADLLACGIGGAGIRIDGVENHVTLAHDANIQANGQNGNGILVAYGRDHQVNVEGHVSATGEGGDAIRFDFGSGCSQAFEFRGSYIHYLLWSKALMEGSYYITDIEELKLVDSWNYGIDKYIETNSFSDHVNGDLKSQMGSLTVSGTLDGKSHAIYIANNAFVDRIDIEKGAKIYGDITSDWKHFDDEIYGQKIDYDSKLRIQYGDKSHGYDEYCKDLVTDLNINGDFAYSGNINGNDNMKLKVNDGTMAYTGTADVVGVQVAEGASLYGGSYKVNEIKKYASFESVDEEAGKLINHGTIGALSHADNMVIKGNLESDGALSAYAGGDKGEIIVTGTATLNDKSVVLAERGLPEENVAILQADGGITGADKIADGQNGLLTYRPVMASDGRSVHAIATAKESLDGASLSQSADYTKLNRMAMSLADHSGRENELRTFYGLSSDAQALKAIDEIGTNDRKDPATALLTAQGSTMHTRAISSRLANVLGEHPKSSAPEDKSAWAKISRGWSKTAGGSKYNGNTITLGYDWKQGENRLSGVFGSYTKSSYGHYDGSEKLQDTRLGYYTGTRKGQDTKLLYADFGYLDGNRSRGVSFDALGTNSLIKGDYNGWLVEIGGEWKHDLHDMGEKTWQVSPYGAFQMSYMKQKGYKENGSLKAYDISGGHNFYAALEGGVEFSRPMPKGGFQFRLGLRHALTGTGYETYETNVLGQSFAKSSRMDKTHLVSSLSVETELASHWDLGAELSYRKGAHDRDVMASIELSRRW